MYYSSGTTTMLRSRSIGEGSSLPTSNDSSGNSGYYNQYSYGGYSNNSSSNNNNYSSSSSSSLSTSASPFDYYDQYGSGGRRLSSPTNATYQMKKKFMETFKRKPMTVVAGINAFFMLCVIIYFRTFGGSGRDYTDLLESHIGVSSVDQAIDMVTELQSQTQQLQKLLDTNERSVQRKYAQQINSLERETRALQKQRDELLVKYEGPDKQEAEQRVALREQAWQDQVELLQIATSRESKRSVIDKFGEGPHYVEMTFIMNEWHDLQEEPTTRSHSFVLEMAPLDAVPHAVHLFMEQVDHKLWDNCWFYLNGPHVLQAGPQSWEEDESDGPSEDSEDRLEALKPFKAKQLDQLAFPEYSEDFPHVPWTLGFTGRPGGPDFYINKVDNTQAHGPGGQYQHALNEQGDSCFAKVVQGQEAVTRIYKENVYADRSEWHYFLEEPVQIVQARVLHKDKYNQRYGPKDDVDNADLTKSEVTERKLNKVHEKMKRKPLLPRIEHQVEP